jgi:phospholipid/cholesterol/gamma-HCH transport system substrate-binding protein
MERNANFVIVGILGIVSFLSLAGFAFWLGKYGVDADQYDSYKTYITESVSGLKTSSPVKLKGIDIGFVEDVTIDKNDPERVAVTFKVKKETPVKTDSFIVLNAQGIAGAGYLEIKGGTKEAKTLKSVDQSQRPVLKSQPSLLSKLSDQAEEILTDMSKTIVKVNRLASEKNIDNISSSLDNFNQISSELKSNKQEISNVIRGAKDVESNATHTLQAFTNVAHQTQLVLNDAAILTQETSDILLDIKKSKAIGKLSSTLDNSNDVINETNKLVKEGKMAIKELKESPSDLLFKQKVILPGPGE